MSPSWFVLFVLCFHTSVVDSALPPGTSFIPITAANATVQISPNIGVESSQALWSNDAPRTSMCQLNTTGSPFPDGYARNSNFDCQAAVKQAFISNGRSDVYESLTNRFDLDPILIESQKSNGNLFTTTVFRILAEEIAGYRTQVYVNTGFGDNLLRCQNGQIDFHMEVWRTDFTVAQWNAAFFSAEEENQICVHTGISGIVLQNAWFTDSHSVERMVNQALPGEQPVSLDFWRSYTTAAGVAGLPQFNKTIAQMDLGKWWWPPLCDPDLPGSVPCGVMWPVGAFIEPGVVQAQIRTLGMRLAVYFPARSVYYNMIAARVRNEQHFLTIINSLAQFVIGPLFTKVRLPDVTPECVFAVDNKTVSQYNCDYRQQTLNKIEKRNIDPEFDDAHRLFQRMQFTTQTITSVLQSNDPNYNPMDAACQWIQSNSQTWVPWFTTATPRVRIIEINSANYAAVFALAGIFLASSLVSNVLLFLHREHPIIRRASYLFCQLILLGASVFYATLMVGIQPESLATCTIAQFMFSVAFSLFYGSLLVKTFRIYKIFNARQLKTQKLTDGKMMFYLLAYAAVDLLIVILWAGISPPHDVLQEGSAAYTRITLCSSEHSVVFSTMLYVWRGLAVLAGGILAIRIRGVDDDFSESKFLAVMSYNIVAVSVVVLGLTLVGSRAPDVTAPIWLAGVALAVFTSSAVFIISKMRGIYGPNQPLRLAPTATSPKNGLYAPRTAGDSEFQRTQAGSVALTPSKPSSGGTKGGLSSDGGNSVVHELHAPAPSQAPVQIHPLVSSSPTSATHTPFPLTPPLASNPGFGEVTSHTIEGTLPLNTVNEDA